MGKVLLTGPDVGLSGWQGITLVLPPNGDAVFHCGGERGLDPPESPHPASRQPRRRTVSPFLSVIGLGVKPKRLSVMLITRGCTSACVWNAGAGVKAAISSRGRQASRVIHRERSTVSSVFRPQGGSAFQELRSPRLVPRRSLGIKNPDGGYHQRTHVTSPPPDRRQAEDALPYCRRKNEEARPERLDRGPQQRWR
jgi:hypothetical protein